jgi:hypothetical protein
MISTISIRTTRWPSPSTTAEFTHVRGLYRHGDPRDKMRGSPAEARDPHPRGAATSATTRSAERLHKLHNNYQGSRTADDLEGSMGEVVLHLDEPTARDLDDALGRAYRRRKAISAPA